MKFLARVLPLLALLVLAVGAPIAIAQTPTVTTSPNAQSTPVVQSAPSTQNTVQTSGPVNSNTTIETGTVAGEFLKWLASAFTGIVGLAITTGIIKWMNYMGIQGASLLRDKLQETVVNGLNAAALNAANTLRGKGSIEVKNQIIADAVNYTRAHASETMTALGLDPNSGAAVEAIKARIATAIADPTTPTPAALEEPVLTGATSASPGAARPVPQTPQRAPNIDSARGEG